MNTTDKLVMMANQIAANLMREADPAGATAEHLRMFWAPNMRAAIFAHLDVGGPGLGKIATDAVRMWRETV